jgi:hypothetical protein
LLPPAGDDPLGDAGVKELLINTDPEDGGDVAHV